LANIVFTYTVHDENTWVPKVYFNIDKIQFKDDDIPVYGIQYRQHTPNLFYCASVSHLMRQVLLDHRESMKYMKSRV
jgi:hypothetical protein